MEDNIQNQKLNFLEDLLQPRNIEETKQIYNKWSLNYEEDIKDMEYNGAEIVVSCFLELNCPKSVRILDIGAGTGVIGHLLQTNGYKNIDALDASPEMLKLAKEKNCYTNLFEAVVSSDSVLPIKSNVYDVVIMAGVFCPGHINYDALPEILRITKSGGTICWAMAVTDAYKDRDQLYDSGNFERFIESICDKCKWLSILGYPKPVENYLHGIKGMFYAMQVV